MKNKKLLYEIMIRYVLLDENIYTSQIKLTWQATNRKKKNEIVI